ncbi:hypothetical protein [Hymenobacter cellulosilyticus]|uniref:Uncharacterized protein n=1 Tax=Hymenobacter cellulosilyticus TaxID=2932248 RepID=A0A8T9Q122_9BACT|nr:hypothetical protein [Hymenobacter cellulosilyticus]UOQ71154.1 hypothetical protein MUN79_21210 [Hymenobacter cellulosilyticus]
MKKLFLLITLLSSFAASAQMVTPERKRYMRPKKDEECALVLNVTKNTDEDSQKDASMTRVAYRPYAELVTALNAMREMNRWADSTYQRRFKNLPLGGELQVTMYRRGAQNADPSALALKATTKDGKEVLAQTLTAGTGRFWNQDQYKSERIIPFVKMETPQPLTLIISDAKLKQDFEYVINVQ